MPISPLACDLKEDAVRDQTLDKLICRSPCDGKVILNVRNGYERPLEEEINQPRQVPGTALCSCPRLVILTQTNQLIGSFDGLSSLLSDPSQKKLDPGLPAPIPADTEEMIVVGVAMTFEIGAEVEQRLCQILTVPELQGNEQPTHASISVSEWMNCLELVVDQSQLNEKRPFGFLCTNVSLKAVERLVHLLHRGRHERCCCRSNAVTANLIPEYGETRQVVDCVPAHPA